MSEAPLPSFEAYAAGDLNLSLVFGNRESKKMDKMKIHSWQLEKVLLGIMILLYFILLLGIMILLYFIH